jgi:hypothetical protein
MFDWCFTPSCCWCRSSALQQQVIEAKVVGLDCMKDSDIRVSQGKDWWDATGGGQEVGAKGSQFCGEGGGVLRVPPATYTAPG